MILSAMTLRGRIMLFVSLCFVLLAGGVSYAGLVREGMLRERFAETKLRSQQALWRHVSGTLAQSLEEPLEAVLSVPGLDLRMAAREAAALPPLMLNVVSQLRRDGVSVVELFAADGTLLYTSSSGGGLEEHAVSDAGVIARVADSRKASATPARDHDGRLLITVMHPVQQSDGVAGIIVLGRAVDAALEDIKADAGMEVYVTDLRFGSVQGTDARLWSQVAAGLADAGTGTVTDLAAGGRVYNAVMRTISNSAGAQLGYQITVEDVTETARHLTLVHQMTILALGAFGFAILALLSTYLSRAFRPLSTAIEGLNALSRGDLSVEVEGRAQKDEVGRVARAVHVFREQQRAYRRQEDSRTRQAARQQRHIRRKMLSLAETLDAGARAEVLRDLERIERASGAAGSGDGGLADIAVAFDVMVQRVSGQHDRLDALVNELRAALEAKTELTSLRQQVEVASRLQAAMLPTVPVRRPDMEVTGRMIQAQDFGGTFFDYFPLDDGRVAVVVAEVQGNGLSAAFFTLVARSLIKALTQLGLPPADCLARANDLLIGEASVDDFAAHAVLAVLDGNSGQLSYATAGTPQVFLLRRVGEVSVVPGAGGPALGLARSARYEGRALSMPPRATLVLSTPGLVDVANPAGGVYSQAGLVATLRGLDDLAPEGVTDGTLEAVAAFIGGQPQHHDLTVLALRFNGSQDGLPQ